MAAARSARLMATIYANFTVALKEATANTNFIWTNCVEFTEKKYVDR